MCRLTGRPYEEQVRKGLAVASPSRETRFAGAESAFVYWTVERE
jgi:hypothetical protein